MTGYCYYLEDGVEEYNTISFNLAAFIHMLGTPARGNGQTTPLVYQSEDITLPADVRSVFVIFELFFFAIMSLNQSLSFREA